MAEEIETVDVTLKIPSGIFDYVMAMTQNLEEYLVHAIVETVYEDLIGNHDPARLVKLYDLAIIFDCQSLDSEPLLRE